MKTIMKIFIWVLALYMVLEADSVGAQLPPPPPPSTTTTTKPTTTTTKPTTTTTKPTTTTTKPTTTTTKPTTTTTKPTTTTTKPTTTTTKPTTTTTKPTTTTTKPTTTTTRPSSSTSATTSTTKATTTTANSASSTTTAAVPTLLSTALSLYNSGTCYTAARSACGCASSAKVSQYYTSTSGSYRIVVASGIPNHSFETGQQVPNPNSACPHQVYMAIPLNPVKGTTYKAYGMGPVGIAISGAYFYNHLSSTSGSVAVINEGVSFDTCNGHSDQSCRYHYHEVPKCIAGTGNCTFVGYMRDGFPVYTYCSHPTQNRYLKSCYSLQSGDGSNASQYSYNQTAYSSGSCDLDQANGYTFPDSRGYAYIFTADYPFIMTGYYGTVQANLCYLTAS